MTMTPPHGLLICDDLIFTSKVTATARAAGVTVDSVRSAAAAISAAKTLPPTGVIIDLHNPGLDLPAFLAELRQVCPQMPRVIGYGSHVDVETLRSARSAGCDRVLPRSQFVAELESKLPEWLTAPPPSA